MRTRSRTTLFLIEQLIVIAVFAICAAACARILVSAYFTARDTRDLSHAILAAENGVESFKATGGDLEKTMSVLGGIPGTFNGNSAIIVYYNNQWNVCGHSDAHYKLLLVTGEPENGSSLLRPGDLSVEKMTGESIISLPVTAVRRST